MASDGMARKTAKSFTTLADALFGPTDSPRLQRESVALAEERGLSLEYLEMVGNTHHVSSMGAMDLL